MNEVKIRKVQRLGASSLIVTLPHSWAKRVGLKPGDSILITVEGESLRLTPLSRNVSSKSAILDVENIRDPRALSYILPCFYVLGYDEVNIKMMRDTAVVSTLKNTASKLPGLEIMDMGGKVLTATILIDHEKVNLKILIKNMGLLTSNSMRILARIARGEPVENLESEIKALSDELYRIRSLVERKIHVHALNPHGGEELEPARTVLILSALILLSLTNTLLLDTVDIMKIAFKPSEELSQVISRLGEIAASMGSVIYNPSVLRSMEFLGQLYEIKGDIIRLLKSGVLENSQYAVAIRIIDFVKILQIICYAVICIALAHGVKE